MENARCVLEVVDHLGSHGLRVAGFVQLKHVDPEGHKRYDLVRLGTDERVVLAVEAQASAPQPEESSCAMAFREEAFAAGRRWIALDAPQADLLVIDEISKLEVTGRGHAPALEAALAQGELPVLLCARSSQLVHIVERFALAEEDCLSSLELPAAPPALQEFGDTLRGLKRP